MDRVFRLFLETASDFMNITDRNGNIIYSNKSMIEALGYTEEELRGMHITNLLHENYRGKFLEDKLRELLQKGSFALEAVWIGKNGIQFYGESKVVAIFDENGKYLGANNVFRDLTKRKEIEDRLRKREEELNAKTKSLEEVNIALNVLLKHTEKDKKEMEGKIIFNIGEMILPYVGKLKKTHLNPEQRSHLYNIENNLKEILSPFKRKLAAMNLSLTPKEIQIAGYVREGRTSKEIAEMLNLSYKAIEYHRNSIRRKLELKNNKINLQSFLKGATE
jgi:PAS domain S-box-containing protein